MAKGEKWIETAEDRKYMDSITHALRGAGNRHLTRGGGKKLASSSPAKALKKAIKMGSGRSHHSGKDYKND